MEPRARTAPPSASTTGRETADVSQEQEQQPGQARRGGWAWLIVGVVLVAAKADALAQVEHHRTVLIVVLALGLAVSVLRARPVRVAVLAAALSAWLLDLRSTALGVGLGLAGFALLMAVFFAIATVLHARQDHARAGRSRAASGVGD